MKTRIVAVRPLTISISCESHRRTAGPATVTPAAAQTCPLTVVAKLLALHALCPGAVRLAVSFFDELLDRLLVECGG
jgi:hypothetical protein